LRSDEAEIELFAGACVIELNHKAQQWPLSRQVLSRVKGIKVVLDQVQTQHLRGLCSDSLSFSWEQDPTIVLKRLAADETPSEVANLLLLDALQHPHIVSAVKGSDGMALVYVDQQHQYYLAMRKATGSMLEDLYTSDTLPPNVEKVSMLKQLASTLSFLEHYKLEHGDIHSKNIMVQSNGNIIIIDVATLGQGRIYRSDFDSFHHIVSTLFGSVDVEEDKLHAPEEMLPLMCQAAALLTLHPPPQPHSMITLFSSHFGSVPYFAVVQDDRRVVLPMSSTTSGIHVMRLDWMNDQSAPGVSDFQHQSSIAYPGTHTSSL
jgi:serine/threonine protein kinase